MNQSDVLFKSTGRWSGLCRSVEGSKWRFRLDRRLRFDTVQITLNNMPKGSKSISDADSARKCAVIYARVSSKEQEKEGFSIPAQLKLLREYAASQGFTVDKEYVDVETAKQTGPAPSARWSPI